MKTFRVSTFASVMLASTLLMPALHAQTASQDAQNAGQDTKAAASDAGQATKKGTKKAYHKTRHATKSATSDTKSGTAKAKEGTTTAVDKTKEVTVKGYDRSKEGVEKVFAPKAAKKSQVVDRSKEAHMDAKDNLMQDKQKIKDSKPQ